MALVENESPFIEVKNVAMDFSGEVLFSGLNLSIKKGEKVVFVGPSGHGKSVFLKLVAGILSPTTGQVNFAGEPLLEKSKKEQAEWIRRMGMLFQKNALFDSMTCGENISFPLVEVKKTSLKEANQKVEYFLEEVGISHAKDLFPNEISGGMQKRLGIARALALDPEILFYDDPTAGLDPITSRKIIQLISKLQEERNSTVLAVTNDMNRAYQFADRIVVIVNGELIDSGTPEQTKQHKNPYVYQFIRGEIEGPLTEKGGNSA